MFHKGVRNQKRRPVYHDQVLQLVKNKQSALLTFDQQTNLFKSVLKKEVVIGILESVNFATTTLLNEGVENLKKCQTRDNFFNIVDFLQRIFYEVMFQVHILKQIPIYFYSVVQIFAV